MPPFSYFKYSPFYFAVAVVAAGVVCGLAHFFTDCFFLFIFFKAGAFFPAFAVEVTIEAAPGGGAISAINIAEAKARTRASTTIFFMVILLIVFLEYAHTHILQKNK
jgi:hypothetical protein